MVLLIKLLVLYIKLQIFLIKPEREIIIGIMGVVFRLLYEIAGGYILAPEETTTDEITDEVADF